MKTAKVFFILVLSALMLTSFLYWIDTDPPYPESSRNLIEFLIICGLIFTLLTVIYLIVYMSGKNRKPERLK